MSLSLWDRSQDPGDSLTHMFHLTNRLVLSFVQDQLSRTINMSIACSDRVIIAALYLKKRGERGALSWEIKRF